MRKGRIFLSLLASVSIAVYFLAFTKDALLSYFTADDCLELHRVLANPAAALVKANLLFFFNSPFYRPMASVWHLLIYDAVGFNPVPFHVANLILLAANIWLTYCLARRLTGSREAGALTALLISYHGRFASLYFDTGFVYDVLCYFFYFSTLLYYVRIRSRQRPLEWRELIVLSVLYVCAVNTKEMALTLPAFLAIYEWLYHRPSRGPLHNLWRWVATYGRGVLITSLLTLAFVIGRAGGGGLLTYGDFRPVFSWDRFMATSRGFLSGLFFQTNTLPAAAVLLIWLTLFVIAWAVKSRALKFAWLFLAFSVIPVAFILRGPGQYYIPLFGWVLYAATTLVEGTRHLFASLPGAARVEKARVVLLFLIVAAFMISLNKRSSWADVPSVALEGEQYRSIVEQVHWLRPALRPGARLLFVDDPIADRWQLTLLMQLSYGDKDLEIDRSKFMTDPLSAPQIASYDAVFSYRQGRFYASAQPPEQRPEPGIVLDEWCRPSVFHSNGRAVTRQSPARRGEAVMSMMQDLGDTEPATTPGQPFPRSPLRQLVSSIVVRVDGQPAEIWVKIGWPEMVNRYRVDFKIPKNVRRGAPVVEVTAGNAIGTAIPIAVN